MKTTDYFENIILKQKRPYLRREWVEQVLSNPEDTMVQKNGRISHWGYVYGMTVALDTESPLRVITLEDGETVHNAFPDRDFVRRQRRNE
ncbi:MAG: hypothetical protein ACRDTR_07170 [Rubrobacter sp.]